MELSTFSAAVMLFFIMDPLGNIPPFLSVLKQVEPERRRRVLMRELLIAYAVLLFFLVTGDFFLRFLHLQQEALNIGGGIILFLIALNMIFPKEGGVHGPAVAGEPLIVPLAIPLVAGPSTLATILLLVKSDPSRMFSWFTALSGSWLVTSAMLMSATALYKYLRPRGLMALERLMGMLLVMMAIQMLLNGITNYLSGI